MATVFTNAGQALAATNVAPQDATNYAQAAASHYIGWGTGTGTAAVGDTTLFTEDSANTTGGLRGGAVATASVTSDTITWTKTLTASGSISVTNAGVFNASSGGTLVVKGDHASTSLGSGEQITYTITLQLKDQSE